MEAGGFEPPSGHLYKSLLYKEIRAKLFSARYLNRSQLLSVLLRILSVFFSNAPVLLPRKLAHHL